MAKARKYSLRELPAPGSVFLTPLEDGRFGVVRVVKAKVSSGYGFVYAVPSSWIGTQPERPPDSEIRKTLMLTHHKWNEEPGSLWVPVPPPESFIPVGQLELLANDAALDEESYALWDTLPLEILLQWRWDHDRDALLVEDAAKAAQQAEAKRIKEKRRAEFLRTVTLQNVSARVWFETWDEELDGPNVQASQMFVKELIVKLSAAPKLTKTVVRQFLKTTVKQFNALDQKHEFIETTHREDICEALEIIMCAARQPELASEIDEWRAW